MSSTRARRATPGHSLHVDTVKIMLDGIVESGTAALERPIRDDALERTGRTATSCSSRHSSSRRSARSRSGWSVHIHAVGDRAVRAALDAFEGIGARGRPGRRLIAHIELLRAADATRFAPLGVTAVVQPVWSSPDGPLGGPLVRSALGAQRAGRAVPLGQLERAGAALAFGSDWRVSTQDPLRIVEAATRDAWDPVTHGDGLPRRDGRSVRGHRGRGIGHAGARPPRGTGRHLARTGGRSRGRARGRDDRGGDGRPCRRGRDRPGSRAVMSSRWLPRPDLRGRDRDPGRWPSTPCGSLATSCPSPIAVLGELGRDPGIVARHLAITTVEALVGLALAFVVAAIVGVIIASSRLAGRMIYPYLVIVQVTPIVAIAPLLIIWLGTGLAPKIAVAFLIAFFPLVVGIAVGLGSVPSDALDLMRSLGAGSTRTRTGPCASPTGCPTCSRPCASRSRLRSSERSSARWWGSDQGLGFLVVRSKGTLDTELLFVAICAAAALGIVMFTIVVTIERLVIWWHPSHRRAPSR